jgi:hypothetical protein
MSEVSYIEYMRQKTSHSAMRMVAELGPETAAEAFEAFVAAFAIAHAAVTDRNKTVEVFNAAMAQFAPIKAIPRLVSKDGERVCI